MEGMVLKQNPERQSIPTWPDPEIRWFRFYL
jgi:hypothetical protein